MVNCESDNYLKKELYELIKSDESIFDFIQNSALDGLWYWDIEKPENEWMNARFWTVLGYNPDEMPHLSSAWQNIINQDDLQVALDNFTKHLENPNHPYDQIVRYKHKNGSTVWIRCRGLAIRDENGKPIRMLGAHHDITELKEKENALIIANTHLNQAQKIGKLGSFEYFISENKVNWSDEMYKIFGCENKEKTLTYELVQEMIHPDDRQLHFEQTQKIINEGFYSFEHRILYSNGSIAWIHGNAQMEYDKNGQPYRMLGTVQDITEQKQVELQLREKNEELIKAKEKAEESDRLKTAFLQNMSHEIRTPMNAIMGFSELIISNFDNKPKLENFSKIIIQRCSDLLIIIDDILDIAKIESGQLPVNIEKCNVNLLFAELKMMFSEHQNRFNKQHIEFVLPIHSEPKLIIETDSVKLKQIFINLIGNAFKFTDSGTIEAGYKFDNNQLIFYVSDTGIGIPPEKQPVIFDRFTQLAPTNRLVGGNGLGLAIVKGLVTLLGGTVWLESELNKGSTFYFTLSCKPNEAFTEAPLVTEEEKKVEIAPAHKTLLVVEDDTYNAAFVKEVLSDTGLTILYAKLGAEAVQIAALQPLDLILMDIRLPDISGYEAIKQIKQQKPNLKIIAQTAYATPTDRQTALESGCVDYISKPLKPEMLLAIINKHLL